MARLEVHSIDPEELIPNAEAAKMLRSKPNTLAWWRCHGLGPAFVKIGQAVFYRRQDLAEWLAKQRHEPRPRKSVPTLMPSA